MKRLSFIRHAKSTPNVGDISFEQLETGYYRIKEYIGRTKNGLLLTITWPDYLCLTVDDCKHTAERVLKTTLVERKIK